MEKQAKLMFNNGRVVNFYGKSFLEGCVVTTDLGSIECDVIIIPKDSYKATKPKLNEDGTQSPSKGQRAVIGQFTENGVQMQFSEGIGLQVTVMKLNDKPKGKDTIFATE